MLYPDRVDNAGIRSSVSDMMALSYTGLRHIRLSENLQSMDEECFFKCIFLEELTLPESLKVIPERAFDSCYSLRTVVLPDGLQSIGEHALELL